MTTLYTVEEVAKIFRKHPQTISRWARTGKLRSTRPGGWEYRFSQEHVDECLASGETPAPKPVEAKPARNPKYAGR